MRSSKSHFKADPKKSNAELLSQAISFKSGKKAIEFITKSKQILGDQYYDVLLLIASKFKKLKLYKDYREIIETLFEENANHWKVRLVFAKMLKEERKSKEALEVLSHNQFDYKLSLDAWLCYTLLLADNGYVKEALLEYELMIKTYPNNAKSLYYYGLALKKAEQSIKADEIFLKLSQKFPDHWQGIHTYTSLRRLYFPEPKSLILELYQKIFRIFENDPKLIHRFKRKISEVYHSYSIYLGEINRIDESEKAYIRAKQKFPTHWKINMSFGIFLQKNYGNGGNQAIFNESINHLKDALNSFKYNFPYPASNRDKAVIYHALCIAHRELGEWEQATLALEEARKSDPTYAPNDSLLGKKRTTRATSKKAKSFSNPSLIAFHNSMNKDRERFKTNHPLSSQLDVDVPVITRVVQKDDEIAGLGKPRKRKKTCVQGRNQTNKKINTSTGFEIEYEEGVTEFSKLISSDSKSRKPNKPKLKLHHVCDEEAGKEVEVFTDKHATEVQEENHNYNTVDRSLEPTTDFSSEEKDEKPGLLYQCASVFWQLATSCCPKPVISNNDQISYSKKNN